MAENQIEVVQRSEVEQLNIAFSQASASQNAAQVNVVFSIVNKDSKTRFLMKKKNGECGVYLRPLTNSCSCRAMRLQNWGASLHFSAAQLTLGSFCCTVNPSPGTVCDIVSSASHKEGRDEFFMIPHVDTQSTAKPVRYIM